MRKREPHIRTAARCAVEEQVRNRASRIGAPLDGSVANIRQKISAAVRGVGVREGYGPAAIQFLKKRLKCWVAEPFVSVTRK